MTQPESANQSRRYRRPTRRHRRNRRFRRAALLTTLAIFTALCSVATLRILGPSLFRDNHQATRAQAESSRERVMQANDEALRQPSSGRPIYRYSVIPGGIENAKELQWVAEHDPIVAAHYRGFDYKNARTVRLALAQTAFISYRIGNRVYWTRHPIRLHKGERVVTDGRILARARCGNRIETVPQQATSELEPPAFAFDQPAEPGLGPAINSPPVAFQSAFMNRPAPGPTTPMGLTTPFGGGGWTPISPPPLPGGTVCSPEKKKKKECGTPATTPEPSTWLLIGTGLIGIYAFTRRKPVLQ